MSTHRLLNDVPDATRRIAWIVLLSSAGLAFSHVLVRAAPFVALALSLGAGAIGLARPVPAAAPRY